MYFRGIFVAIILFTTIHMYGQKDRNNTINRFKTKSLKVKSHFEKKGDALKIKAADFLLKNLYSHKTLFCEYTDSKGATFLYDETTYPNLREARKSLEQFKSNDGSYKIKAEYDIEEISSQFIIDVVETSVDTWQSSPWKDSYDFQTFCEFILPYRNSVEPFDFGWKKKYYNRYEHVIKESDDEKDPVSACTSLLQELDYFEFLMNRFNPQPALSIDQMHFRKNGSCTDLASLAVLSARALGLAVTYDFTPYHAASSSSHYWNTIVDSNGKHIPFNGTLDLPFIYNANYRRLGKVLRRVFSNPENNLTKHISVRSIPDKKLRDPHVIDVTKEYVNTKDINYKFDGPVLGNIAYLTVFNKGIWRPIWWGKTDNIGNAKFIDMGQNIVYLPSNTKEVIKNKKKTVELSLEKYPVHLTGNGKQVLLKPNFDYTFSCVLTRQNEEVGPYRDLNTVELIEGQVFNLYYWDGLWKFLSKKKVVNAALEYSNLPGNSLFRMITDTPDGFERIFTIDKRNCRILWF